MIDVLMVIIFVSVFIVPDILDAVFEHREKMAQIKKDN
jgi:hypothetical protein